MKLEDRIRRTIRQRGYSRRTEDSYVDWYKRFVRFHGRKHPAEMGEAEIEAFLSHLATDRNVAPATQKSALNGIYLHVIRAMKGEIASPLDDLPVFAGEAEVDRRQGDGETRGQGERMKDEG